MIGIIGGLLSLLLLSIPVLAIISTIASALYLRATLRQIEKLRAELSHRAENDIKMFNANRESAGLPPL